MSVESTLRLLERRPDFEFWVSGVPAPQGSKRHVGGGRMVEMSKKIGPWRKAVAAAARAALPDGFDVTNPLLDGPLVVFAEFWLPRPKTYPKTKVMLPVGPPDVDKLARGALDPLTQNGVIRDDSRIVDLFCSKRLVPDDDRHRLPDDAAQPGAMFSLYRLEL